MNRLRAFWRKNLRVIWQDFQWPVVGGLVLVSLALGYIGFARHFALIGERRSFWDCFYLSLQLFTLESGSIAPPIPWQLEIARLLAPALAVYAAAMAILAIFHQQLQLLRLRFIKNHVVICGLGQKGLRLARGFLNRGFQVIVIDQDEKNVLLDQCRERGAIVLIGDATDKSFLRKAGIHRASYLVSVCRDDGVNAEVAARAFELVRRRKGQVLNAFIHIVDLELCVLLREREIATEAGDSFRLELFNILESGARMMLQKWPPFSLEEEKKNEKAHFAIVGLGKMGRSLLVQAARQWWLKNAGSGKRLRITIVDKAAEAKRELLRIRYPQLEQACDLIVKQMDKNAPEFEKADFLFDEQGCCDVNAIYICFDDDVHALTAALTLNQRLREYKVPIVVRMAEEAHLAVLIQDKNGNSCSFENVHVFGLLDQTCRLDLLLCGTHWVLARAIHEEYVRQQRKLGESPETNPSIVDWDKLPDHLKESNWRQADDIGKKLKAVGCGIVPLTDWGAGLFEFEPDEIELLARMEHDRWMKEKLDDGWKYAPGPKNNEKKTHPSLVSWEELSEEEREKDRSAVRNIPKLLAQAGFQIYRRGKR